MKRSTWYAMPVLLLVALIGFQTSVSSQRGGTANLNVRVFFGPQMGGQAAGPCSCIEIVATPQNGLPIKQAASGPQSGAQGGQCTATLKNVPAGVPITLKAVNGDLSSMPDDTHELPAGKWTNPLKLQAGTTVTKYIKIDGKP